MGIYYISWGYIIFLPYRITCPALLLCRSERRCTLTKLSVYNNTPLQIILKKKVTDLFFFFFGFWCKRKQFMVFALKVGSEKMDN